MPRSTNVTIMDNARLGDNCIIYPQVSIYHDCKIGNNVTLHSGAVIGAQRFSASRPTWRRDSMTKDTAGRHRRD